METWFAGEYAARMSAERFRRVKHGGDPAFAGVKAWLQPSFARGLFGGRQPPYLLHTALDFPQVFLPQQLRAALRHKAALARQGVDEPLPFQFVIGSLRGAHLFP